MEAEPPGDSGPASAAAPPLVGQETRAYLAGRGLPAGDAWDLPDSPLRFADGASYRLELAGADTPELMRRMIERADRAGIVWHRFTETRGIRRLSDAVIREMVAIARDREVELLLSAGPRAVYSAAALPISGAAILSDHLRGMEQIVFAVEEVRRAASLGVRGVLVNDAGLLRLLSEMRSEGFVPPDLHIRVSAQLAAGNPFAVRLLQDLGADTVNLVPDLTLPMIAAIRQTVHIPLDLPADVPWETGGTVRTYEVPEMVRVGAPVYLRCSAVPAERLSLASEVQVDALLAQVEAVVATMQRYAPGLTTSAAGAAGLAVPAP